MELKVTARDKDGEVIARWTRAEHDQLQEAMRRNDRATATALYETGKGRA